MANSGVLNVKAYGAKGDGITDDTAAFMAAKQAMETLISSFALAPSRVGNAALYIPAGTYLIKAGKALMDDSFAGPAAGYNVIGDGRMITRILFDPPTPNQYLLYNRDGWSQIHMSDISFYSKNASNNFFYSYSSGLSSNMEFERCHWDGKWNYGFHLEGTNTNSEMAWYRCGFSGEWSKALYIPSTASDQLVNYDFISCQFEVAKGDFIDVQKGGSVNVVGGSFLYYPSSTVGGTLFKLGVGGGMHNGGAMRFVCIGARIELPRPTSMMLECEWPSGQVSFINVDNASQAFQADKSRVNARFTGSSYPIIVFDNCNLQGRHEYKYTFTTFQFQEKITYRNCAINQYTTPEQFIGIINTSGFNNGGVPQISFENCRGSDGADQSKTIFDTEMNWSQTTSGLSSKKVVSINTANNALPYGKFPTQDIRIPLGAIITKATLFMSPGTVTSSWPNWSFKIRTSEAAPTTLINALPIANDTKKGFNTQQDLFYICDTDEKRHLVLEASAAVNEIKKGYCLIEYIG